MKQTTMAWHIYASSDHLARNPVQHTRLLALSANAQNISKPAAPKANPGALWSQGSERNIEA
jgi:hypothetical protein